GRPVAGAVVCMLSTWDGDYRDQYRTTRTDAEGRYSMFTGHVGEALEVAAFSAAEGMGTLRLTTPPSGGAEPNADITLHGIVHVPGTVTDKAGVPLEGVRCRATHLEGVEALSDAQGEFDLGLVARGWGKAGPTTPTLKVLAPRAGAGLWSRQISPV